MSTRVLPALIKSARVIDGVDLSDTVDEEWLEYSLPATLSSTHTRCTISFWFERTISVPQFSDPTFFSSGSVQWVRQRDAGELVIVYASGDFSKVAAIVTTDAIFPYPSGPKHVLVVVDTTQATATGRLRLWIDGVEITSFSTDQRNDTNISQNESCAWFGTTAAAFAQRFGSVPGIAADNQGIMGDMIGLDGIAETDPAAFTGSKYSGPYGARGFHLDLSDPNNLGNDISGNGRHFALTNVAPADHVDGWITL